MRALPATAGLARQPSGSLLVATSLNSGSGATTNVAPSSLQKYKLPPAWIGVGAIDLFVQEDIEYARRLAEAGVPVELHVAPGAFHGFDFFAPASQVTTKFVDSWTRALRRGLGVTAGGGG